MIIPVIPTARSAKPWPLGLLTW
jgi:phospholipase C